MGTIKNTLHSTALKEYLDCCKMRFISFLIFSILFANVLSKIYLIETKPKSSVKSRNYDYRSAGDYKSGWHQEKKTTSTTWTPPTTTTTWTTTTTTWTTTTTTTTWTTTTTTTWTTTTTTTTTWTTTTTTWTTPTTTWTTTTTTWTRPKTTWTTTTAGWGHWVRRRF